MAQKCCTQAHSRQCTISPSPCAETCLPTCSKAERRRQPLLAPLGFKEWRRSKHTGTQLPASLPSFKAEWSQPVAGSIGLYGGQAASPPLQKAPKGPAVATGSIQQEGNSRDQPVNCPPTLHFWKPRGADLQPVPLGFKEGGWVSGRSLPPTHSPANGASSYCQLHSTQS